MDLNIKRKERKALNSSLYSSTHRNARTIKLVSLRVRRISTVFFYTFVKYVGLPVRLRRTPPTTAGGAPSVSFAATFLSEEGPLAPSLRELSESDYDSD